MPSPVVKDKEAIPTKPIPPTKPISPATPKRSLAVKRAANATPANKAGANKATTPKSAPARTKSSINKPEPTLLGDFLLGRPSVNRVRRMSCDVTRTEVKQSAVNKLQPPSAVKNRVKEWQKANAAVTVDNADCSIEPDEIFQQVDDKSVTEEDRRNIKFRKQQAKAKKPDIPKSDGKANSPSPVKIANSPKKRVVSDDHWMKKARKSPPRAARISANSPHNGVALPKDFVKSSATNPPLEKKIEDWTKRISSETIHHSREHARQSTRSSPTDGGRRILSSKNTARDVGKIKGPMEENRFDDGIRIAAFHDEDDENRGQYEAKKMSIPRRRSGRSIKISIESESSRAKYEQGRASHDDQEVSDYCMTPTHVPRRKSPRRKSLSPESMTDIPFGSSAFSVLDIPVGGQVRATRAVKPQRQPSLSAVPKALKKVYAEGLKIMHDTVDPPRITINQPTSIESWLRNTSDPFIDNESNSESTKAGDNPRSARRENDECSSSNRFVESDGVDHSRTDNPELQLPPSDCLEDKISATKEHRHQAVRFEQPDKNENANIQISSTALRRSPANRKDSSSKPKRRTPLKNILVDAFRGESEFQVPLEYSGQQFDCSRAEFQSSEPTNDVQTDIRKLDEVMISKVSSKNDSAILEANVLLQSPKSEKGFQNERTEIIKPQSRAWTGHRTAPATGRQRLSTIASVETFSSASSLSETSSDISQTTITQTTITQNTSSTLHSSDTGRKDSSLSHLGGSHAAMKRRLTKHADLLSVLSLPDNPARDKEKSIRSARSIRTTRTHLEKATVSDLLQELVEDEVKYMRELKTLVDGVVPVLLASVLSKSESAVAAGLFDPIASQQIESSVTKPIVDMGIALERLKSLHKHIPLQDVDLLVQWASRAYKIYDGYITAWRMGFHGVIVNLAPTAGIDSAEEQCSFQDMPCNEEGDVLNENGERADVAFLLKRPLVRIRYLTKALKGIHMLRPSANSTKSHDQFQELLAKTRRRIKEEEARLQDQAANNTDASRARDPKTLAAVESVGLDRSRQVGAKDFFDFALQHSSGQRIDCRVELILRDKPHDQSDVGDVLICELDSLSRWLLFPPIQLSHISARLGDRKEELVVMIRGSHRHGEWREYFTLIAEDGNTASEWMRMLGTTPQPPNLDKARTPSIPGLREIYSSPSTTSLRAESPSSTQVSFSNPDSIDVPIGERQNNFTKLRSSEFSASNSAASVLSSKPRKPTVASYGIDGSNQSSEAISKISNDAMQLAGCHSRQNEPFRQSTRNQLANDSQVLPNPSPQRIELDKKQSPTSEQGSASAGSHRLRSCNDRSHISTDTIPRATKASSTNTALNTGESARAEVAFHKVPIKGLPKLKALPENAAPNLPIKERSEEREDAAPAPPPHRTPSPAGSKVISTRDKTNSRSQTRKLSSPLKHEYQPSEASETSLSSEESDYTDYDDSSSSSDDEELESAFPLELLPDREVPGKTTSPAGSFYGLPNASLAPSNSASQAPYRSIPLQSNVESTRLIAAISCWSHKGRWVDLYPGDCSIVVGPGLIEAFVMSASHSTSAGGSDLLPFTSSDANGDMDAGISRPLVALELTPIVPLRQSNALDIEIRSPPTARSTVKCTHTVRFRSRTLQECSTLYAAIHSARLHNPVYVRLEQERIVNSYGGRSYQAGVGGNRRRSWFGRSNSYRASARAPSVTVSDNSTNSFASAISRLRKMGGIGGFNIARSSIDTPSAERLGSGSAGTSLYTKSIDLATSGITPPRTPTTPSIATTENSNVVTFGSRDLRIRLYLLETSSKWCELGHALLTVTYPPRGMRQASSLYHGVEKRIIVTKKQGANRRLSQRIPGTRSPKDNGAEATQIILDVVLGAACFSRLGVVGIAMNVWEDITGDNGEVGRVAAVGGVSGRTRKWMFQCATAAEATWIFALVGGGAR